MEIGEPLVELLKTAGGYGFAVVFLWLYYDERKATRATHKDLFDMLKQHVDLTQKQLKLFGDGGE